MPCTHTTACSCGSNSFDLATFAMLTLDITGEPKDATATLDGFHKEPNDITLTCRDCGRDVMVSDQRHKATVIALIRQEKRLSAQMRDFSSYTFEDGTVVEPDEIKEPALRDVTAGAAYQQAAQYLKQYRQWLSAQKQRIEAGEINDHDLNIMRTTWRQSVEEHFIALLDELAA